LNDWEAITDTAVFERRSSLIAGNTYVPLALGLSARAPHMERGERDCLNTALPTLAGYVKSAARVIEIGPFAGQLMAQLLGALERPKAGVVMTASLDPRQFARLGEAVTTAQVSHINHDAMQHQWPLEAIGAGRTLVFMGGGGFGLTSPAQAFEILENASQSLSHGDFLGVTLEMNRDGAVLDALYTDFGHQIVAQTLASLGRAEGLVPRHFFDGATKSVRFGAVALEQASLSWNGTRCDFEAGTWLDMGAMTLHTSATLVDLHPDFEIHDQWHCADKTVTLLLLRKT
jgi:hypothetical protein